MSDGGPTTPPHLHGRPGHATPRLCTGTAIKGALNHVVVRQGVHGILVIFGKGVVWYYFFFFFFWGGGGRDFIKFVFEEGFCIVKFKETYIVITASLAVSIIPCTAFEQKILVAMHLHNMRKNRQGAKNSGRNTSGLVPAR